MDDLNAYGFTDVTGPVGGPDTLLELVNNHSNSSYEVGDATRIVAMLVNSPTKFPSVQLKTRLKTPVVFKISGTKSKAPGLLTVAGVGRYGEAPYYGRVVNGVFRAAREIEDRTAKDIAELIRDFAADPAGVTAKYGHSTGHCSFCLMPLTDERSLAAGYGPVCAGNFNLPWGGNA